MKLLNCPEFEVKSKIRKIFTKHNLLEEYFVRIYESDPTLWKKQQQEIDEKRHTDKDLIFEKKRQEALGEKLGCKIIKLIQIMQKMVMIYIMRLVI